MTRLFFQVGRLRLRMVLVMALCLATVCGGNLLAYWGFFGLTGHQLLRQGVNVGLLFLSVLALLSAYIHRGLAPVIALLESLREQGMARPTGEQRGHRTALRFPLSLGAAGAAAGGAAVIVGGAIDVLWGGMRLSVAVGLGLANLALTVAMCLVLYVVARAMLRPIVAHFRHEVVPAGPRISVRAKVTLTTAVMCLAASAPTALLAAMHASTGHSREHVRDRAHLAEAIAYGGTALEGRRFARAVASMRLASDGRIRLEDDDATSAAPLPPGLGHAFVHVTGPTPPGPGSGSLIVVVVLVLGLSLYIGHTLGSNLASDVELVSLRVRDLAESEGDARRRLSPLVPQVPQFSDLRRLADAVNELLARIISINVSHWVAMEKTLEADRVKNQFLANVSHDLRSPLNSVLGFSELLLRINNEGLTRTQRDRIETIHRAGNELLLLINEVLDTAKVEAGRVALAREDTLPVELMNRALKEVRRRGVPDTIAIETELQAGLQAVSVDPQRFVQALAAIIQFCVDSMEQGRIIVQLKSQTLPAAASGERLKVLRVRVATTSGGMVASEVKQLFNGFRRTPGRRGLGLGLPLARTFVEMHDGRLDLTSTPGIGTTFTLDLPLPEPVVLARLRPRRDRDGAGPGDGSG